MSKRSRLAICSRVFFQRFYGDFAGGPKQKMSMTSRSCGTPSSGFIAFCAFSWPIAVYHAPEEPALVRVGVTARQSDTACEAQALVTVTDSILSESRERGAGGQVLRGYTLEHVPGKLWRSRFEAEQNVIVVNSGHRDYVFAARSKALKLRYLVRLYAKEMVRKNFPESCAARSCSTG